MDKEDLEAELIKRNREIAKARDEVLKVEKRMEEAQLRNDELLEKLAEVDANVNKRDAKVVELETKVAELEETLATALEEAKTADARHQQHLDSLRGEFEVAEKERQKEDDEVDELKKKIEELEEGKAELERKIGIEQTMHQATKTSLHAAEAQARDLANKNAEMRKQIDQLEEDMVENQQKLSTAQAQQFDEERTRASAELHRVTALLEEQKGETTDLEQQSRQQEQKISALRTELEDAQRDLEKSSGNVAILESARDEALGEYKQFKAQHDDVITAMRKSNEEALNRATGKAAALDGRLDGQRLLLEEASQSLARSERLEEQVSADLSAKVAGLTSEYEEAEAALEKERANAASALSAREVLHASELETEMVVVRRNAASEVDAAKSSEAELAEAQRRLEARLSSLQEDNSEASAQQARMQESLRSQGQGLRERLAETEERCSGLQQDGDKLRKDLEEARQEAERASMASRLEQERLQQALDAEVQSRASAEKVSQSQLEEKDTLLEHRMATCERLEKELEDTKQKIADLEQAQEKAKEAGDKRVHEVGLQKAELEKELRTTKERVTEAEGRLESQRQYLEQLNKTLSEAQETSESLMATKASLEKELQQEQFHKDAVSASLLEAQDESSKRCRELEERLALDRDAHECAIEDAKKAISQDLRQTQERLASVETELTAARERVQLLMRNKADLQQEVGQQREKFAALEAGISEHRAEKERLSLELDQARESKGVVDKELEELKAERKELEGKVSALTEQVEAMEEMRGAQTSDFSEKVRQLDVLINTERDRREAAERALTVAKDEAEVTLRKREQELQRANNDLQGVLDSWRVKAEEQQVLLTQKEEQLRTHKAKVEDLDSQRRDVESVLRGELAACETKIRRLEIEVGRGQTAVEESKADAAHLQSTMTSRIIALERQLEQEEKTSRDAKSGKEAAEAKCAKQDEMQRQLQERLSMASEELFSRQVDASLEKQRLSGALEESRRTLRNSMTSTPAAAVDSIRVQGLEQQLAEERRKSIEQAVTIQRTERRCGQLEESQKQSETQRSEAVQRAREAERKCMVLEEDLRKSQTRQAALDQQCSEVRESAAMSAAEMSTIRYEAKYESAKLRGALDELRYMLKMQDPPARKAATGSM